MENPENQINWGNINNQNSSSEPLQWSSNIETPNIEDKTPQEGWGVEFNKEESNNNFEIQENNIPKEEDNNLNNIITYEGQTDELYFNMELFTIKADNSKIINEINQLDLQETKDEGRFTYNPLPNTELGNLIHNLVKLGVERELKFVDSTILKTNPNESILNAFSRKPSYNFIYYVKSNDQSGKIIVDFGSIGGPSYGLRKPADGQLLIIPGWVPFRISKNNSSEPQILITGVYN